MKLLSLQKRIYEKLKYKKFNEKQTNRYGITPDKLAFYDIKMNKIVEPGEFIVMVGACSDDKDLLKDTFFVKYSFF